MPIRTIKGDTPVTHFPKEADFLLAASVTYTCKIDHLTQAGIPGMIPLTPTLDAELITTGTVHSLPQLATTPTGVPTPALITRAAEVLKPFHSLGILDLGLEKSPQQCHCLKFGIEPSHSIVNNAFINARCLFFKGVDAARQYTPKSGTLILAESTPSGTTTANAALKALGYQCDGMFSSSFKAAPHSIKEQTIQRALLHVNAHMGSLEKLGCVGDNMLIFCAGFILEASQRYRVIVAGGTQMAALLLIAQKLSSELHMHYNSENLALCTTAWVAKESTSDILGLLNQLNKPTEAYYADFNFNESCTPILHSYDEGEAKEGVGAGAALAYLFANGFSQKEITKSVETVMQSML
jgi:uncharacterized protein (TIGR00303 family)